MWLLGRRRAVLFLLVLAIGIGTGVSLLWGMRLSQQAGKPAATPSYDGRSIFKAHCAICHGPEGKGDGPGASVIHQKMLDFTDAAAMRGVNDRFLFDIIKKGGSQFGRANAMPAWGMKLSDEEIRAVVAFIRSLASQNPPASTGRKDAP
jgi:mono/diheme cytochrome c family protein